MQVLLRSSYGKPVSKAWVGTILNHTHARAHNHIRNRSHGHSSSRRDH